MIRKSMSLFVSLSDLRFVLYYEKNSIKLTHYSELDRITFAISFHIRRDARVVSGLVSRDSLQRQVSTTHYYATLWIVHHRLILQREDTRK